MGTAGIGSESGGMIFAHRSLLDQHLPRSIEDIDRECTMEQSELMCFHLFFISDDVVLCIDEEEHG